MLFFICLHTLVKTCNQEQWPMHPLQKQTKKIHSINIDEVNFQARVHLKLPAHRRVDTLQKDKTIFPDLDKKRDRHEKKENPYYFYLICYCLASTTLRAL